MSRPRPRRRVRPWETFADAVLRREALRCRVGEGREPRDVAGLFVGHEDVDRILEALPGLDGADRHTTTPIDQALLPLIETARLELHRSLETATSPADDELLSPADDALPTPVHDALPALAANAGLGDLDVEVLAVVAAVELDPRRQRLVAYLQDSVELPRITLAGLPRLFAGDDRVLRAVAPSGPLTRCGLVELEDHGPWSTRTIGLATRIAWALTGVSAPDRDLPLGVRRLDTTTVAADGPTLLLVPGGDRASRMHTAIEHAQGTRFLVSPPPTTTDAWSALVREATVIGAGIVLELADELPELGRATIAGAEHLTWVLCSSRELPLGTLPDRSWSEVPATEAIRPTDAVRSAGAPGAARLSPTQRELVTAAERGLAGGHVAAVRRLASGELDRLAVRVRPQRGWEDLVLPPEQTAQLRELVARERQRHTVYDAWGFDALPSAGVVAVFSGPSGTGKTLAAEIIAGELGLDAYKVDLSAIVSKYIGETEKNLERIFGAAAAGNVVLFFDEADALFGKRSDVGDAHDRYANIEVAYLLQRLETYGGLVLLATNLQRNMDSAFLRRIHVAVDFPLPDVAHRRSMWERSFPPGCPTETIDAAFLARQFELSGGSIRNAALGAAFLAAEQQTPVSMDLIVLALKREFQKLGRLRTEEEFGRYFPLVSA